MSLEEIPQMSYETMEIILDVLFAHLPNPNMEVGLYGEVDYSPLEQQVCGILPDLKPKSSIAHLDNCDGPYVRNMVSGRPHDIGNTIKATIYNVSKEVILNVCRPMSESPHPEPAMILGLEKVYWPGGGYFIPRLFKDGINIQSIELTPYELEAVYYGKEPRCLSKLAKRLEGTDAVYVFSRVSWGKNSNLFK